MTNPRSIHGVFKSDGFHWVGDGFHVTQVIPGARQLSDRLSPFLMMDYHAPYEYSPTTNPRGVGVHPHRGFETVTIAFEGALAHHDSSGGGGVIRAGDVQWMTAARGILHKEYHEEEWARSGGRLHMMQLWVNLPADHKMDDPGYQALTADEIGVVDLPDGAGSVKVIAGQYKENQGPAHTFTPVNLWEMNLAAQSATSFAFPAHENAAIFVLDGTIAVNGTNAGTHEIVVFDNEGSDIELSTSAGAHLVVLNGEPIDEPVVAYGPFVMNTEAEIAEAINDFNSGRFGQLV